MKKISIFDTTISNHNLGNQIIMDDVYVNLFEIFPSDFFYKLPSMEITSYTKGFLKESDIAFFGGTNVLTGRMEKYKQWGLSVLNVFSIKNVVLMGCGWWQYQDKKVSLYTKFLLKKTLSKKYLHSVRDSYTQNKLREIGISNVLNTGCPTLWSLTKEHCKKIKKNKSKNVVCTITDYKPDIHRDDFLFSTLCKNYEKLFLFIQGSGDLEYFYKNFKDKYGGQIEIVNPNIESFDSILSRGDVDYIGTRLHAGIRAMQRTVRSIIIGVDNRATEMSRDFNIPFVSEKKLRDLTSMINSDFETIVNLPMVDIEKWKSQFKK